jgi:hypothetical protein
MKYVVILWVGFSLSLYGFTYVWQKFVEKKIENIIPGEVEEKGLEHINPLKELHFDVREYRLLIDNLSLPDVSKKIEEELPPNNILPEKLKDNFKSRPEYKWPSFFDTNFDKPLL